MNKHSLLNTRPDERKSEAVKKYPTPKDKVAIKSFAAFTNYFRRFIKNHKKVTTNKKKISKEKLKKIKKLKKNGVRIV